MKILLLILSLFISLPAFAASRITATVTLTNNPSTNFSLTVNGDVRYWGTNTAATNITIGANIQTSATNLFRNIAGWTFSGPVTVSQPTTNTVAIMGAIDQAMTATIASNWAFVTYTTQQVTTLISVRVPISGEYAATNRTNIASHLVKGINDYASNSFDGTALALTNFIGRTNGQTITGNLVFNGTNVFTNAPLLHNATLSNSFLSQVTIDTASNGVFRGTLLSAGSQLTNAQIVGGGITNAQANRFTAATVSNLSVPNSAGIYALTATNTINRGSALQSYSNDATQLILGQGATATNANSIAIGYLATSYTNAAISIGAFATNYSSQGIAIGSEAFASNAQATAIGKGSVATGQSSFAFGKSAYASEPNAYAIGFQAQSLYTNSMAIGYQTTTDAANQLRLGTSSQGVSFQGGAYFGGAVGVGAAWGVALPTSFAGGIAMTNGTSATADPTNGVVFNAASGEWIYRASKANEGSGAANRVHNYGAETNGSGTDYTLTTSMALCDFGGVDPDITLPSAGTYLLTAIVTATAGGTANDSYAFKFYNVTTAADIVNSSKSVSATPASQKFQVQLSSIVTVTSGNRIQLYGQNATAARGVVNSTETKIVFVRLF